MSLGKAVDGKEPLALLPRLLDAYRVVLRELAQAGAEWVQMDELCLVTDLAVDAVAAYRKAYDLLSRSPVQVMLTTYFGGLGNNAALACSLQTAGIHVDAVRAPEQLMNVVSRLGAEQTLSLGWVDGRNIWLADLDAASALVRDVVARIGSERVQVAPSCSLLHVLFDTAYELKLIRGCGRG